MVRLRLDQLGHKVVEVADGRAALAEYDSQPFDLIITDLVMYGMEGMETIMEFRKRNPRPRIIAMSGGGRISSGKLLPTAELLGAKASLAKPFSLEELKAAIENALT